MRVGVVQNDQYAPNTHAGEEDGHVLLAVSGHDSNPVTGPNASSDKAFGHRVALLLQAVVRPSGSGPWHHQTLSGSIPLTLEVE